MHLLEQWPPAGSGGIEKGLRLGGCSAEHRSEAQGSGSRVPWFLLLFASRSGAAKWANRQSLSISRDRAGKPCSMCDRGPHREMKPGI